MRTRAAIGSDNTSKELFTVSNTISTFSNMIKPSVEFPYTPLDACSKERARNPILVLLQSGLQSGQ